MCLADLEFNPILHEGFDQAPEPQVLWARAQIEAAQHIVWVYPIWWASWPALLKGFVDRIFVPGWAFEYGKGKMPTRLLKGRSARLLTTMDSPSWWYRLIHRRAATRSLKQGTLHFVGISPVKESTLYNCRNLSVQQRQDWLDKISGFAQQDAKRLHQGRDLPVR